MRRRTASTPAWATTRWIAIAIFNDDEWRALVSVMGEPGWATDPRFATQAAGSQPRMISMRTWGLGPPAMSRHALMHRLQAAGVAAGAVQTTEDTIDYDPQISRSRGCSSRWTIP